MQCAKCAVELGGLAEARASIAIFVMGDEYIYTYWSCEACGYYTVEAYHDRFMGEDDVFIMRPISREVGERVLALIKACPNPQNKNCDCPSHQALYYGVPR